MLTSVDKIMDDIEDLIRGKALVQNMIKDLNIKLNLIESRVFQCEVDLKTIEKKIQIKLKIVGKLKLEEDGIIDDVEASIAIKELENELQSYILQNESEDSPELSK